MTTQGLITGNAQGSADVIATFSGMSGRATVTVAGLIGDRTSFDRPDDISGYQVKFMYVVPSDGGDDRLDVNDSIRTSVAAFQLWFEIESGGQRLRVDTYSGQLDIAFVRLAESDSQVASAGSFMRERIESAVHALGFNAPGKLYAVYYTGSNSITCGSGAWPPVIIGNVVTMFPRGTPPGAPPCSVNRFATSPTSPGYFEFAMLHEVMHGLGAVPSCAPHQTMQGHTSDSPTDLMYAGSLPWQPAKLDLGRDDYFGHGRSDCLDIANSAFLTPTRSGATPPPGWPFLGISTSWTHR